MKGSENEASATEEDSSEPNSEPAGHTFMHRFLYDLS
jgi:hypothetical protein